jgi:hypothetical protein
MTTSSSKPRSVFSAVCRSNGIVLGGARATVGSRFPRNASRVPAYSNPLPVSPFGNVIAAVLPRLRKLAARVLERGGPLSCARTLAAAFSRRRRDIRPGTAILAGAKSTTSKCFSFLYPLLKHCQEPRSGIFQTFSLSPVLCRSVAHERNHDRGTRRDVGAVRQG